MYKVFSEKVMDILEIIDPRLLEVLDYITSPGIIIPTFLLMVLIIYYLVSMTGLLRESNEDLKNQVCISKSYWLFSILYKKVDVVSMYFAIDFDSSYYKIEQII